MGQITGRNNDVMDVEESSGRGLVDSKSRPSEEVEAVTGDAFILHGECHLAAAANGGLLAFKNTSDTKEVVITRLYIDPHVLVSGDTIVTQLKNPTVVGGTDITDSITQGKVQKNFGKGKNITGILIISDGSADLTYSDDGQRYHSLPVKSMTPAGERDMKGTNVIAPNTTIGWGWKTVAGDNAKDGDIIALSINCFIRDIT